jgi:hypothetical protein
VHILSSAGSPIHPLFDQLFEAFDKRDEVSGPRRWRGARRSHRRLTFPPKELVWLSQIDNDVAEGTEQQSS